MAQATPKLSKPYPAWGAITGWTIVFMVLLRVAIGWHFFYEGMYKIQEKGKFSSTPYLMASVGPFKDVFHWMVDDMDGTKKRMTGEYLHAKLDERFETIKRHYGIKGDTGYQDEKKVAELKAKLAQASSSSDDERQDLAAALAIELKKLTKAQVDSLAAFVERKKHGVTDNNTVARLFDDETLFTKRYVYAGEYVKSDIPKPAKPDDDPAPLMANPRSADKTDFVSEVIVVAKPDQQAEIVQRIQRILDDLDKAVQTGVKDSSLRTAEESSDEIRKQIEKLDQPLPPAQVVPAGAADTTWIKQGYVNGLVNTRYDLLQKTYGLTFRQHQSKYGWRYRDQKIKGHHDLKNVDYILNDPDFKNALEDYQKLILQIEEEEALEQTQFDDQRLEFNVKKRDTLRNALLARVEAPLKDIDLQAMQDFGEYIGPIKEVTPEQFSVGPVPASIHGFELLGGLLEKIGVTPPQRTLTYYQDIGMMLGLTVIGACLILGLFTRLASLGGAVMLFMFYLAMPPFPGAHVPANAAEGHYLLVNKNLIEMLALLMFFTSGIGRWFGLDAFIHALFGRRPRAVSEPMMPPRSAGATQSGVYVPRDSNA